MVPVVLLVLHVGVRAARGAIRVRTLQATAAAADTDGRPLVEFGVPARMLARCLAAPRHIRVDSTGAGGHGTPRVASPVVASHVADTRRASRERGTLTAFCCS